MKHHPTGGDEANLTNSERFSSEQELVAELDAYLVLRRVFASEAAGLVRDSAPKGQRVPTAMLVSP